MIRSFLFKVSGNNFSADICERTLWVLSWLRFSRLDFPVKSSEQISLKTTLQSNLESTTKSFFKGIVLTSSSPLTVISFSFLFKKLDVGHTMNLSVLTYERQGWQVPIGLGLLTLTRAQLCKYISDDSIYNPQHTSVTCRNVDTVFILVTAIGRKKQKTNEKCLKAEQLKPEIQKQKQNNT